MSFPWFKGLRLTAGCRPSNLGTMLALCWAYVGLCWAYVGPCGAILGAMLGPRLGHLCWNDLKMSFFPPRAPSWSPKPRKNRGFVTSPRARNTVKKGCFWTPQAQNTVNYVGFSRPGVGRGWFGGGSAAGAAAPITFGKDTGCVASARIFLYFPMVSLSFPHHFPRPTLQWQPRRGSPRPSPRHCPKPRWHCTPTARTRRKRGLSGNPADLGEFWWIFGVLGNKVIKTMIFGEEILKSCLFVTCWEPNIFVEFWWFLIGGQDGETSWNMFFQRRLPRKEMGDGSEW